MPWIKDPEVRTSSCPDPGLAIWLSGGDCALFMGPACNSPFVLSPPGQARPLSLLFKQQPPSQRARSASASISELTQLPRLRSSANSPPQTPPAPIRGGHRPAISRSADQNETQNPICFPERVCQPPRAQGRKHHTHGSAYQGGVLWPQGCLSSRLVA